MKKRFFNGKRILTLLLALSLVMGEAGVVAATPVAAEEQTETSVSANDVVEVATEETEVEVVETDSAKDQESDDVTAETAYDGTPSRVIGLEGSWDYDYSITLASGQYIPYIYVMEDAPGVKVIGTKDTYKVPDTNMYLYNGQYYTYASQSTAYGTVTLYDPIQLLPTEPVKDPATGMYLTANGYYSYSSSVTIGGVKYYYFDQSDAVDVVGVYPTYDAVDAAIASFAVKDTDGDIIYYATPAGKYYRYENFNTRSLDNGYTVYSYKSNEISFTAQYVDLKWTALSSSEVFLSPDGKSFYFGYQVEEDGVIVSNSMLSSDGQYAFTTSTEYDSNKVVNPGQSVNYRVRGLYYTRDEVKDAEGNTKYTVNVFAVGDWSETYTYTAPTVQKLAVPTGLALSEVEYDEEDGRVYYTVDWNEDKNVSSYRVRFIFSNMALNGLTNANWENVYGRYGDAYQAFLAANPGVEIDTDYWYGPGQYDYPVDFECKYVYACVYAGASPVNGYMASDNSPIVVAAATKVVADKTANVPALQNFRVEYSDNGYTFDLAWTPVDANVVIYAVETAKGFPQHYVYSQRGPAVAKAKVVDADGDTSYEDLYQNLDSVSKAKIYKWVQVRTADGIDGEMSGNNNFSLKPGVNYSFVAYTYDNEYYMDAEKAPVATIDGLNYTYYTDMSAPTATLTAKKTLSKPNVYVASAPDSLKLTMQSSSATGFEIYKKSGKKYKKLTTTTDSVYVDTDVKKNSKYNYKVRAYYYNKDSKVKCYSEYEFVTGETSDVANMDLSITKKNKTSVTLKWTKVKGAIRYEIYRSNIFNTDLYTQSKKNDAAGKDLVTADVSKYELIKTLKGGKTKFVDKKLTTGDAYSYIVKAYYKNGKSTMLTQAEGYVALRVQTPVLTGVLKGSTAKYSWDKDKFASKYEIRYRVYDSERKLVSAETEDDWTYASTKKNSYNVSNIPLGGYVYMQIRAYGDKKYTEWSDYEYVYKNLGVVKNIKATNVTVKNAAGEEKDTVKITWKKVSGATYYKVFRSTKQSYYNADAKKHYVENSSGDFRLIAKESNDNEGTNQILYNEYAGKDGTITGTSAYDNAQLDTGVTYYYYVVAYADKNERIHSSYADNTNALASGAPASVSFKATANPTLSSKKGKAVITWTKVPGATKYYVYRSTKKNGGYKLVGTTKKATFTDKKVSKGKTYYYKIEARGTNALKANFTSMSDAKKIKVKK